MTTVDTLHDQRADTPTIPGAAVTLPRVLRSEWVKLRSLRSTWFSLGAALIVAIGLALLFGLLRGQEIASHGGAASVPDFDPTQMSLRGLFLAQLAVGVLGVLFITGEYATGMIRASLTAVPHRWPVLLAKAVVLAVVTFIVCTVGSLAAFLVGQAGLNANHLGVGLGSAHALRAVIGGGLYLTAVALLALGCGVAIRSTGGAIAALFGLLLVLPILGQALPSSWAKVNEYLPMNAGMQIMRTRTDPASLGPWTGIGVLALWALAALVVGFVVLERRDA